MKNQKVIVNKHTLRETAVYALKCGVNVRTVKKQLREQNADFESAYTRQSLIDALLKAI